jgi:hypothetical protein
MNWSYSCPHCSARLNPDETVVLVGEYGGTRTLIGLHPEPGNYRAYLPSDVQFVVGTRWELSCPVCHQGLTSEESVNLCSLNLLFKGAHRRVLFSCIAGEQATFCVEDGEVVEQHGSDSDRHSLELLALT